MKFENNNYTIQNSNLKSLFSDTIVQNAKIIQNNRIQNKLEHTLDHIFSIFGLTIYDTIVSTIQTFLS